MSTDSPANGGDHITTIYHPGDGNDNVLHTSVSTKICRGVRVAERQSNLSLVFRDLSLIVEYEKENIIIVQDEGMSSIGEFGKCNYSRVLVVAT